MLNNLVIIGVKPATLNINSPPVDQMQRPIPIKNQSKKRKNKSRIRNDQANNCESSLIETKVDLSMTGLGRNRNHSNETSQIPDSLPVSFQHFLEHSYRIIADVKKSKEGSHKKINEQQENLNWNSNAPSIQRQHNSRKSNKSKELVSVKYRKEICNLYQYHLLEFFWFHWSLVWDSREDILGYEFFSLSSFLNSFWNCSSKSFFRDSNRIVDFDWYFSKIILWIFFGICCRTSESGIWNYFSPFRGWLITEYGGKYNALIIFYVQETNIRNQMKFRACGKSGERYSLFVLYRRRKSVAWKDRRRRLKDK